MKNNIAYWLFGIFVVVVAVLLLVSRNVPLSSSASPSGASGLKEQTDSQGDVIVTVTPGDPSSNSQTWDFQVGLNTHSGDLNQDLTKTAELQDSQGKVYKPLQWQGPPPGGHHINGILKFPKPNPVPSSFKLTIRQVEGVDRTFTWQLNK